MSIKVNSFVRARKWREIEYIFDLADRLAGVRLIYFYICNFYYCIYFGLLVNPLWADKKHQPHSNGTRSEQMYLLSGYMFG